MYGHQRHLVVALGIVVVHVGHQHHALQPLLDRRLLVLLAFAVADLGIALLLENLHRVEQLLDIVDGALCIGRILGAKGPEYARPRSHLHTELIDVAVGTRQRQVVDQLHELRNLAYDGLCRGIGRRRQRRLGHQRIDSLPHRHPAAAGQRLDTLHGRIAYAARRIVDYTLEGLVVPRVDYQPQVAEHILYLLVVVERAAAVDTVRYALAAHRLLEGERLAVGAVKHGNVAPCRPALPDLLAQVRHYQFGLLAVGVGTHHMHRRTLVALREAVLLHAVRVVGYDRVGRLDDGPRRTVVLFELEDPGRRIVALEIENVLDLGAAERVDALRVVSDHAHAVVKLRQAAYDDVLRIVGVLILVHEHIPELLLVAGQHVLAVTQQYVGLQQQVVEIHRSVLLAALAIDVVYVAELRYLLLTVLGTVRRIGEIGSGRNQAVLGIGDARGYGIGLVLVVRQVHVANDGLQQVLDVRRLIDGERLGKTYAVGIFAQYAGKYRVERSHAYVAALRADHALDALAHLLGGLVGKGQRKYVEGCNSLFYHVGYARGQHARLARARSGDYERRLVVVGHRLELGGIQSL